MKDETIISNVRVATMDPAVDAPYGTIEDAELGISQGKIIWLGTRLESRLESSNRVDGQGSWLTPGLIDCHTHLVYGGNRAMEWESRLEGLSYEDIARQGGGILSTVMSTREASFQTLLESAQRRLRILMAEGVTCVEIKSGYGLTILAEQKMLAVARELGEHNAVKVCKTFLGAHALPPEFKDRADAYIQHIVEEMLPAIAGINLIDAVDVFCEGIGFNRDQCERVFQCAKKLGLPVKGHVEQLSFSQKIVRARQ